MKRFDSNHAAFVCDGCGAEFRADYADTSCIDCGSALRTPAGELVARPADVDDGWGDEEGTGPAVGVLAPFPTDNPYLRKMFEHPAFGIASSRAIDLFLVTSPDDEEEVVAAVHVRNGAWRRGVLVLTTHWLRWIQSLPTAHDEVWSLEYDLEYTGSGAGGVLSTVSGHQFQLLRGKAKRFAELHRLMQLAQVWQAEHAGAAPAVTPAASTTVAAPGGLADELAKLAALRAQGVLSEDEFTLAKAKLLG